ncbi:MAG TPA: hypothetical protein VK464_19280 [Symbiobacteriaceae bacterium]|jgi:hypothetical protein|nr:hypothetical protein [Symbiobacteriaceae bacterium]
MGLRRKRLIVQADLTSEEDQAFLAWVLGLRRRKKLAEVVRQGLWSQYQGSPRAVVAEPTVLPEIRVELSHESSGQDAAGKLKRLMAGF